MPEEQLECGSCLSVQGKISLTNVPRLYDGEYWIVEHIYPSSIVGWLVVVSKAHRSAIHELSSEESVELGILIPAICRSLHAILGTQKEYVFQMAEKAGFDHVHFHVIARMKDWPDALKGPAVFSALAEAEDSPLTSKELAPVTAEIAAFLEEEIG